MKTGSILNPVSLFTLLVLIVGWPWSMDLYLLPRGIAFFLLATYLTFLEKKNLRQKLFSKKIRLFLGVYLLHVAWQFASCLWALNASEGLFPSIVSLSCFFILIACVVNPLHLQNILMAIGLYTTIILIVGFIQLLNTTSFSHEDLAFVSGLNANKNFYSGILFLSLPFSLILLKDSRAPKAKWIYSANICGALIMILILQTRAVWLGTIVAVISLLLLFTISFSINKHILKRTTTFLIVTFSLVGLFFTFNKVPFSRLTERIQIASLLHGESSIERIKIWKNTCMVIKDNPILGVGSGNWPYIFSKYGIRDLPSVQKRHTVFQSPHNDYLWVASETGLPGLVLYLFILLFPLYNFFSGTIRNIPAEEKTKPFILLSFLTGYYFYSAFDFPKYRIEHNFLFTALYACILSSGSFHKVDRKNAPGSSGHSLVLGILFIFCAIFFSYRIQGEVNTKKMLQARNKKDTRKICQYSEAAVSMFYKSDPTNIPINWYIGHARNTQQETDKAYTAFVAAEKISPYNFYVLGDLAAIEIVKGKYSDAEKHLLKAVIINDKYDEGYYNLSTLYFYKKDLPTALFYAKKTSPSGKHDFFIQTIHLKMNESLR